MGQIQLQGELAELIQKAKVFGDAKMFVDALPLASEGKILDEFYLQKKKKTLDIEAFAHQYFSPPHLVNIYGKKHPSISVQEFINAMWIHLHRDPDEKTTGSTLIPLPHPYILTGGKNREMHYAESFFMIPSLIKSGHKELAIAMCRNFSFLIDELGYIPTGNRLYFLPRSNPPYFALMVDYISRTVHPNFFHGYISQIKKEYSWWMRGEEALDGPGAKLHVVEIDNDNILNRYYDDTALIRPESFHDDRELASNLEIEKANKVLRSVRAAAESGWETSSRWLESIQNSKTIQTIDIVPVDLNCLLYFSEKTLSTYFYESGKFDDSLHFNSRAERRKEAIQKYFWSESLGYFVDYNFVQHKKCENMTLAGIFPLFCSAATTEQAKITAEQIRRFFLKPWGLVNSVSESGSVWDAPFGNAAMQWITVQGLRNYGFTDLAEEIKVRWLETVHEGFRQEGKTFSFYNMFTGEPDTSNNDQFTVTNGVVQDFSLEPKKAIKQMEIITGLAE